MGLAMTNFIIAVRNYAIAIILAWMGFSAVPAEKQDKTDKDTDKSQSTLISGFTLGH